MGRSARVVLLVVAAVVIVAAVAGGIYFFTSNALLEATATPTTRATHSPTAVPSTDPAATPTTTTAPTGAPAPEPTDVVQPEPSPAGPAIVTIASWGADGQSLYASGIVTGDLGDRGTCTLTATSSSGAVLTGSRAAELTPAAVNCGIIQISAASGLWTLVLSYQSEVASASSEPTEVTQP